MKSATKAFHNRLAVVFDFDDAPAPGGLDTLTGRMKLETEMKARPAR